MTHGAHSPCGVARTKTRWISPSLACPRLMSGSTERVLIAPPSGAWPIPAHADVRSTTSRASDRSNTPFRRTLVYLLAVARRPQPVPDPKTSPGPRALEREPDRERAGAPLHDRPAPPDETRS